MSKGFCLALERIFDLGLKTQSRTAQPQLSALVTKYTLECLFLVNQDMNFNRIRRYFRFRSQPPESFFLPYSNV